MEIQYFTLYLTFVTLVLWHGTASAFIQVNLNNGSIFWGFLEPYTKEYPWIETPTARVHNEYQVLLQFGDGSPAGEKYNVEGHLRDTGHLTENPPGRLERLSQWFKANGHLPKEAYVLNIDYYISHGFHPYNGVNIVLRGQSKVFITVKGTTSVVFSELQLQPKGITNKKFHADVRRRWNERFEMRHPTTKKYKPTRRDKLPLY